MTPVPAAPASLPSQAAHILVVDDAEKNTRLLADLLGARGYRTSKASSGAQALEMIGCCAPDLVLLDVMMPGMSGFEVCRTLRADPRHALLPVVMVTALDPAIERSNGLDAGADDFLTKPINQAELLARVRSLLRVKTLQDQLLRERAAPPAPAAAVVAARRGEFDLLCLRWPALVVQADQATQADQAEPDVALDRRQALQDRLFALALRHGGSVTEVGAMGLTVLFEHTPSRTVAAERAWALADAVMALSEGLCAGMACGSLTLGSMRSPTGAVQPVAIGAALLRADRLSQQAAPNAVAAEPELLAHRPR
jgi:DNA-binding response OmpR family regulator